jgi:hypothetical protein
MKTDDLIDLMASAHSPVDTRRLSRGAALMAALALALTAVAVIASIGFRPDLPAIGLTVPVAAKLALGAAVAALAVTAFTRSLRPGASGGRAAGLVLAPLAVAAAGVLVSLAGAAPAEWPRLAFGRHWLACLTLVPLYGLLPLAMLTLFARQGAPVDPARTGFLAGLASGGLATVAYSLHCTDDTAAFIGIWYGLATLFAGLIGRLAAPAFLRW